MIYSDYAIYPMPRSLPELSSSKSSKSSSFHSSYQSDDNTILTYLGNFEEIGLEDDEFGDYAVKPVTNLLDANFIEYQLSLNGWWKSSFIDQKRNLTDFTIDKSKKYFPEPIAHVAAAADVCHMNSNNSPSIRSISSTNQLFPPNKNAMPTTPRCKSPSKTSSTHTKRSIWQVNKERKTVQELEREFDEDNGDDVPDECFLDNVPLSPRMKYRWTQNLSTPVLTRIDRPARDKNKLPGKATLSYQGERNSCSANLRDTLRPEATKAPASPDCFKARPKSWNDALLDLDNETKKLTEALEIFQEEKKKTGALLSSENSRLKPALAEILPLRKTEIMVDPLPISREKEAVLSRTRPSWLPPKNPAEEKRHVKEYQKMMALSLEADRKKEVERREKSVCRDDAAKSLLRIWEERVLPNWKYSIRQKQTRELWWKGVAPRCRGNVWKNAIGNELGLTDMSYSAALQRAKALEKSNLCKVPLAPDEERKMILLERISHDVALTYPELRIFQPEGPLHVPLLDILKAYTMYRSDVGYIYGISNCAALLLLNLPTPATAFIALSNLLNRPLPLSFHTSDTETSQRAFSLLFSTLMNKSPRLHAQFQSLSSISSREMVFKDFFTSMGTAYMNLDNATRLWDIMLFEGDTVLVRAATAFLINIEGKLFDADTPQKMVETTKNFPLDIAEEAWVNSIRLTY